MELLLMKVSLGGGSGGKQVINAWWRCKVETEKKQLCVLAVGKLRSL